MEIYVTLHLLGIHDPLISLSSMGQVPIKTLLTLCRKTEDLYKRYINKVSHSQANTAFLVYNFGISMSGGKPPRKITASNFLPFPEAAQVTTESPISRKAKEALVNLMKSKLLTHKQITIISHLVN